MKRYVVTGGRGFVGKRLVELLAEKNDTELVISLDVKPINI